MKITIATVCSCLIALLASVFPVSAESASQYHDKELAEMESEYLSALREGNLSGQINTASELCSAYTISGNGGMALSYADSLLSKFEESVTVSEKLSIYAYSAQAYLAFDRYSKADSVLSRGLSLWDQVKGSFSVFLQEKNSNPTAIAILYNAAGVYAVNVEMNYEKATEFFLQGMNFAKMYLRSMDYAALSCNLIMSYFIRNSYQGLQYAMEVYNEGKEADDDYLVYMGAYESAMMYYVGGDYKSAEKYILEALESSVKINTVYVYNLYANILYKTGRDDMAGRYYRKAMSEISGIPVTIASYVYLSYGSYLLDKGETDKSIEVISKGLEIAESKQNKVFTYQLNKVISDAYRRKGMYDKALHHYMVFHQQSDSIFNLKRERVIGQLMLKYRTARYEAQVKEKDIQIIKKNRSLTLLSAAVVMILVVSVILWVLNRRTNRMYTRIVRQYQNAIAEQKRLTCQLEKYQNGGEEDCSENTDDTLANSRAIAEKLEYMMTKLHVYKDNTLSREKLAEMVGTNRTYLTKIIKDNFNKSVNQYINSYRINRAIEILSTQRADIPMKSVEYESGFSSASNFFKLFKEEVGMSPAKFREKVLELSSCKSDA